MGRVGSRKGKTTSLIAKAFQRCRSLGHHRRSSSAAATPKSSRPWRRSRSAGGMQRKRPPAGCFTVYVGPSKERFVIKTECINHPLFRALLDEAEMVHGFTSPGPLELPCDVELFCEVLCEMAAAQPPKCSSFTRCHSYRLLLCPSRLVVAADRF